MINFLIVYLLIGFGQASLFGYALKRTDYPLDASDYLLLALSVFIWPIELLSFLIYLTHN
jgi:hypothetical protein